MTYPILDSRKVLKLNIFFIAIATLKGISQVILVENWITGIIVLIAMSLTSYELVAITVLSALVGTMVAYIGGADRSQINQGLFGYNAVLTGIALSIFLNGGQRWYIALAGAFISTVLTAALMEWFKKKDLPVLTFPFVIVTWMILLASYRFELIKISNLLVPKSISLISFTNHDKLPNFITGFIHGIGQVYLMDHFWTGLLILVGVFAAGWKPGVYALTGSVVSTVTASFLHADKDWISMGLYGYNGLLTMLAIAYVFKNKRYSILAGLCGAMGSVLVMAGISVLTSPYGIPAFTMPFTITAWTYFSAAMFFRNGNSDCKALR